MLKAECLVLNVRLANEETESKESSTTDDTDVFSGIFFLIRAIRVIRG
jgi:hypothetical protein